MESKQSSLAQHLCFGHYFFRLVKIGMYCRWGFTLSKRSCTDLCIENAPSIHRLFPAVHIRAYYISIMEEFESYGRVGVCNSRPDYTKLLWSKVSSFGERAGHPATVEEH